MYNPLGDFKPQNPFENMEEPKSPLDWGKEQDREQDEEQDNDDNPFGTFKGFINPFEEDEYGDD